MTKTYEATALYDASAAGSFTVEAESLEQAIDLLSDKVAEHSASLCHQCSDSLNLGDMIGLLIYCDGKPVADTTYSGESIEALQAELNRLKQTISPLDVQERILADKDMSKRTSLQNVIDVLTIVRIMLEERSAGK